MYASHKHRVQIEVKTSAYLQSWHGDDDPNSKLRFTIRPTRAWAESGRSDEARHQSDMYIFCVFTEKDRSRADPLCLDSWEFYPVLTCELDAMLAAQQTASMGTLLRLCPEPFDYGSLQDAVLWLASNRADGEARHRIEAHRALKRASVKETG